MINKDQELLVEAYKQVIEKAMCKCTHARPPENCDCDKCDDCKKNQKLEEGKKAKPDYMDADKDGNKKEPMKKALKDKKSSNFKDMHKKAMSSKSKK